MSISRHPPSLQAKPLVQLMSAFFLIMAAYFLLLPLRDEAGVSLGTHFLPLLFLCSLFITLAIAPIASTIVNLNIRPTTSTTTISKGPGLSRLYRILSLSILLFILFYQLPDSYHSTVKVFFFLWVSALNLVAVSAFWAMAADVFTNIESSQRLFGLLGAGATAGQLIGSILASYLVARSSKIFNSNSTSGGGDDDNNKNSTTAGASMLPLVVSSLLLEVAGRLMLQVKPPSPSLPSSSLDALLPMRISVSNSSLTGNDNVSNRSNKTGVVEVLRSSIHTTWLQTKRGFFLIQTSQYLIYICVYLILNYIISSSFYFQKALVAHQLHGSANRVAFYANINSASAAIILVLQLFATGRLIKLLGTSIALAVLPSVAGVSLALISMHHTAAVIAAMEIIRKLIAYSLARPTRETLFAVLTKDEKYIAKLFIDTVIQRAGDTAAALMFQIIVPALGFGAGTLAVFAIPVCFAMALVGYTLGAMQHNLSQQSGTTNKNDSDSDFDR